MVCPPPLFPDKKTLKRLHLKLIYLKARQKLGLAREEEIKKMEEEIQKMVNNPFIGYFK